jgi:hypothetical protein
MSNNTQPPTVLGYVGVDLDGTLAHYTSWHADGGIGDPIPAMVDRVKGWLQTGVSVRIISARVAKIAPLGQIPVFDDDQVKRVQDWCEQHLGKRLPVQFWKDYGMLVLFDDRARQVELNTGRVIGE